MDLIIGAESIHTCPYGFDDEPLDKIMRILRILQRLHRSRVPERAGAPP